MSLFPWTLARQNEFIGFQFRPIALFAGWNHSQSAIATGVLANQAIFSDKLTVEIAQ